MVRSTLQPRLKRIHRLKLRTIIFKALAAPRPFLLVDTSADYVVRSENTDSIGLQFSVYHGRWIC
jgi:hypothetical protein